MIFKRTLHFFERKSRKPYGLILLIYEGYSRKGAMPFHFFLGEIVKKSGGTVEQGNGKSGVAKYRYIMFDYLFYPEEQFRPSSFCRGELDLEPVRNCHHREL